jgi:hypothetical protein
MSLSDTPNPLVVENFIGGSFVKSSKYLDSFDPSTGEVWAQIPDSDLTEVDDAVQHARNAFPMYAISIIFFMYYTKYYPYIFKNTFDFKVVKDNSSRESQNTY